MLLGIIGEGVPPGSPNPDHISDQNMSFSTPVFRPGSGCSNAILRGPVPEKPISSNPGLKICSFLVFYLPMYCLEKHYVSSLCLGVGPKSIL